MKLNDDYFFNHAEQEAKKNRYAVISDHSDRFFKLRFCHLKKLGDAKVHQRIFKGNREVVIYKED